MLYYCRVGHKLKQYNDTTRCSTVRTWRSVDDLSITGVRRRSVIIEAVDSAK